MLKKMRNRGITLISLIVTIVVLLILAGVTINTITGSESAMEKATQAREENNIANELEQIKLAITNGMANGLDGRVSDVNLRESLKGIIDDSELENISGEAPWTITTKLGKGYEINSNGQVEPAVTPTDIYVTLDGDTLRFYSQKDNVKGTLVNKKNGNEPINLKGEGFIISVSDNPWYNNTNIKKVSFEEVVVPTSTMRWFVGCSGITNIENIERLNTRYVTNMNRMFYGCSGLTELDLSKFKTDKVTDMSYMFYLCLNLATIYVGNGWNTDAVTQGDNMFNACIKLVGGQGTRLGSIVDKSMAKIDGWTSNPGYFTDINAKSTPRPAQDDYIDLSARNIIGTENDVTDDWKILYDGTYSANESLRGYIYCILADYLPNSYEVTIKDANNQDQNVNIITNAGLQCATSGSTTYGVKASSRNALVNGLADSSKWEMLVKNEILGITANETNQENKITVKGGLDWGTEMVPIRSQRTPVSYYLPHPNEQYQNCDGYWLASADPNFYSKVRYVKYDGNLYTDAYDMSKYGICPVVKIPASKVKLTKSTTKVNGKDLWTVSAVQ